VGSPLGAPAVAPGQVNPPTVVTEPPSALTSNTATLNATVNPNGGPVTRCGFAFGASESLTPCATSPGSGHGAVPVSASLHGLVPGVTYRYRIVATNPSGTSYGQFQSLTVGGSAEFPPSLAPGGSPAQRPAGGQPAPAPLATLASRTLRVTAAGALTVRLGCPAGVASCAGSLVLRTLTALSAGGRARRVLTLASGSFKIAGGRVGAVTLHLGRTARLLLSRLRRLRAKATLNLRDAAGHAHVSRSTVTLVMQAHRG
jgi:hypothetical protein